jgi:hypothetical protein
MLQEFRLAAHVESLFDCYFAGPIPPSPL